MSDADNAPETDVTTAEHPPAEDETLSWDDVKQRERAKRQATKYLILEYADGQAVFEYQMVENVSQIARKHTTQKTTRSGSEPKIDMSEDQEWAFAAELFGEAIVDAPDGFKATERELREGLTKPVVDDMVDAITDFASMDEETYIKFR